MKSKYILAAVMLMLTFSGSFAGPQPGMPTTNDPSAWEGLTPDAIARVKKGEIVIVTTKSQLQDNLGKALIKAAMVFNTDINETFRILTEYDKLCDYLESCDQSILVKKTDNSSVVDFTVKVLGWEFKYRVIHYWDTKKYYTWWKLDPNYKSDIKVLEGSWQLYYMDDNHTLARYSNTLIVKEFIPASVQEALARRDVPKSLEATRQRVHSHGTYKKKGK